jgi:hypothetical protein
MICPVYSISGRHGPFKDITYFIFEWEITKNSGQPTQFWILVKIITYKLLLKILQQLAWECFCNLVDEHWTLTLHVN